MLAEADAQDRSCADPGRLLDNITIFVEFCREHECLYRPHALLSDHSTYLIFRHGVRDPNYLAHDDCRCEVVLMSGLPGAGKDHWIRVHLPDWSVVSLD